MITTRCVEATSSSFDASGDRGYDASDVEARLREEPERSARFCAQLGLTDIGLAYEYVTWSEIVGGSLDAETKNHAPKSVRFDCFAADRDPISGQNRERLANSDRAELRASSGVHTTARWPTQRHQVYVFPSGHLSRGVL